MCLFEIHGGVSSEIMVRPWHWSYQAERKHCMQVIVDGWGRVIKEPEQMEYLKKLEFIPFKVRCIPLELLGCDGPSRSRCAGK